MNTFCPFCGREISEDDLRTDYILDKIAYCEWCEEDYIQHCLELESEKKYG